MAAAVGLVMLGGTATAAPNAAPVPYVGASIQVTVNVGLNITITGQNFGDEVADSEVDLTIIYGAVPSGLRGSQALAQAAAVEESFSVVPDENGNFEVERTLLQYGPFVVVAEGVESDKVAGAGAAVYPAGSTTTSYATTTVVAAGGGSGGSGGSGSNYSSGSSDTSLAYTGTSLAGPIVIGLAALLAGLALLFFGTRGVIRRKGSRTPTPTV